MLLNMGCGFICSDYTLMVIRDYLWCLLAWTANFESMQSDSIF